MGELRFPEHEAAIRWREAGAGAPTVVLPGLSLPVWPMFEPLMLHRRFSGRRFVLIDYLGSGASDHPKAFDYSLASQARTVVAVMDHLGIGTADILGHSMGGTVAIRLALDHPGRVGRMAVAEANLVPGGGAGSRRIASEPRDKFISSGFARMLDGLRAEGLDPLADCWSVADPAGLWASADALVRLDPGFRDRFFGLDLPRTFIFGDQSLASGPAPDIPDPHELAAAGIIVEKVAGAGHMMMWDNPEDFARAVAHALPVGT